MLSPYALSIVGLRSAGVTIYTPVSRYPDERGERRRTPRDPELDERILDAARRLLAERGYQGLSIDAVARAAGTTRPTVYLRFAGKEELATSAVAGMTVEEPLPQTDDIRADLVAELRHFRAAITRPNGFSFVGTVLAEEHLTPALIARFRERLVLPRRHRLAATLERGRADRDDPPRPGRRRRDRHAHRQRLRPPPGPRRPARGLAANASSTPSGPPCRPRRSQPGSAEAVEAEEVVLDGQDVDAREAGVGRRSGAGCPGASRCRCPPSRRAPCRRAGSTSGCSRTSAARPRRRAR